MPTTADIRRFIMDIFSDEELRTFCFYNFPDAYKDFTNGMTKSGKTLHLLDYCQRRERLPDLLKCLRTERPVQFDARLGPAAAPQSSQPTGTTQPDQNTANISGGINLQAQDDSVGGDVPEDERPVKLDTAPKVSATTRIENPFYTSGRINDPKLFSGRKQLVRELRQELSKRTNVSLVGEAQTGKSSLLYYLYKTRGEWLPDETIEYLDLQRVFNETEFCETVLQQLNTMGNTLRDLHNALKTRRVILLLDEVERLAEEGFSLHLQDLLRSLAQEPNFKMCVATQIPLEEVFLPRVKGSVSPFHNIFTRKSIGAFTEAEARRFLAERLQNTGVAFTEHDVARLIAESNCHPAKLQQAAKALFDEHAEG
jgi:hypothetical protein